MNDDSDTSADEDAKLLEYHFDLFVGDHVQLHERMRDVVAQISESKNTIDAVIKRGLQDVRLGVGYDHVESVRELEEECNLTTWLDTVHSLPGLDAIRAEWAVRVLYPILSACETASVSAGKALTFMKKPDLYRVNPNRASDVRIRIRNIDEITRHRREVITTKIVPSLRKASLALRAFLVEHNNRKSTIPDSILTGFRECSNNPGARVQFFEELWNAVFTDPMNNGEISTLKAKVLPIFTLAQYPLKTSVYEAYGEIRGVIHYLENQVMIVDR